MRTWEARAALVAASDACDAHRRTHRGAGATDADRAAYDVALRAYRVARGLDADSGVPL